VGDPSAFIVADQLSQKSMLPRYLKSLRGHAENLTLLDE